MEMILRENQILRKASEQARAYPHVTQQKWLVLIFLIDFINITNAICV